MQGTVGEKHADLRQTRGDLIGQCAALLFPSKNDGPHRRAKELYFLGRQAHFLLYQPKRVCRGKHHGQGFIGPLLLNTQAGYRLTAPRVAHQMITAHALDRDDAAIDQAFRGRRQRGLSVTNRLRAVRTKLEPGSALRARHRFRVKAPVLRIRILGLAGGTKLELGHRRVRTIVWHPFYQRIAGPALSAVDEGISETAVVRIQEFSQTILARVVIRGHKDPRLGLRAARNDREILDGLRCYRLLGQYFRPGKRRRKPNEVCKKSVQRFRTALNQRLYLAQLILHPAAQAVLRRQTIDEGAKADALHVSRQAHATGLQTWSWSFAERLRHGR